MSHLINALTSIDPNFLKIRGGGLQQAAVTGKAARRRPQAPAAPLDLALKSVLPIHSGYKKS